MAWFKLSRKGLDYVRVVWDRRWGGELIDYLPLDLSTDWPALEAFLDDLEGRRPPQSNLFDDPRDFGPFEDSAHEYEDRPDSPEAIKLMREWNLDPDTLYEFFDVPARPVETEDGIDLSHWRVDG
jgi:hypothetical protein